MLAERILEEKTLNWIFDQASLVAPQVEEAAEDKAEDAVEEKAEEATEEKTEE